MMDVIAVMFWIVMMMIMMVVMMMDDDDDDDDDRDGKKGMQMTAISVTTTCRGGMRCHLNLYTPTEYYQYENFNSHIISREYKMNDKT